MHPGTGCDGFGVLLLPILLGLDRRAAPGAGYHERTHEKVLRASKIALRVLRPQNFPRFEGKKPLPWAWEHKMEGGQKRNKGKEVGATRKKSPGAAQ